MQWNIKKIINFKYDKKKTASLRSKAIKGVVGFFALMILFTSLSRAADTMTIPKVSTIKPEKKTIDHSISAPGKIVQNREQAISTVEGIRVDKIFVNIGQDVKLGDVLFTLNMESLMEKKAELEREIAKMDLNMSDLGKNRSLNQKEKNIKENRSATDYDIARNRGNEAIDKAYNEMIDAWNRYDAYRKSKSSEPINGNQELDTPQPQTQEQENGGDQEDILYKEYEAKADLYQAAVDAAEDDILAKKRALEDAGQPLPADSSFEKEKLDREGVAVKLQKVITLIENEGKITASTDGLVTDIKIITGDGTTEGMAMLLADITAGVRFVAEIPVDQQQYIARKDKVSLKQDNGGKTIEDVEINMINQNPDNPELLEISALLPQGTMEIGSTATLDFTKKSEAYKSCIPLTALHQDGNQKYVLVLKEKETVLGTELEAERVDVTVLKSNEKYAALADGAIQDNQRIITSENKEIKEGDRVRLIKE